MPTHAPDSERRPAAWHALLTAVLASVRPSRVAHYLAMVLFGVQLRLLEHGTTLSSSAAATRTVLVCLATGLAWLAQVLINDVADYAGDRISNPTRPLVRGQVSVRAFAGAGAAVAAASILLGALLAPTIALLLTASHLVGLLYSVGRYRTKRYYLLGTTCLATISLLQVLAGYAAFARGGALAGFPSRAAVLVLVLITFGMTMIYLKDEHGDRAMDVRSPSALWGDRTGRQVTAALVTLGNLLATLLLNLQPTAVVLFGIASLAVVPVLLLVPKPERYGIPGTYLVYAAFAVLLQFGLVTL